jgi:hypothetical protein
MANEGEAPSDSDKAAQDQLEQRMKETEESLDEDAKAGAQHTDVSGDLFPPEKPPPKEK